MSTMFPENTCLCGLKSEEICEPPVATVFWGLTAEPLDSEGIEPGQSLDPLGQR